MPAQEQFWLLASGFRIPLLFSGISRAQPLPGFCRETRFIGHLDFDLDLDLDLDLVHTRRNGTMLADDIAMLTMVRTAKARVQDQVHVQDEVWVQV